MIYVDRLRETKKSREWPFASGCHMFADSVEELHTFAASIGMKRIWFQGSARLPHYDLTPRRRAQAIKLGAKEIDRKELSRRIRQAAGKVTVDKWRGCYSGSWVGLIVDDAMVHPAKFSRNLIRKIYDHLFDEGLLQPGAAVIDCFGGIALGGLEAMLHGCHHTAVELEPRFCAFGQANIKLWEQRFAGLKTLGSARIIQGDSTRLLEMIRQADAVVSMPEGDFNACVSSPPFNANQSNAIHGQTKGFISYDQNAPKNRMKRDYLLAESEDNLGNMDMSDEGFNAAISSPPFADSLGSDDPDKRGGLFKTDDKRRNDKSLTGTYGTTEGQLGALRDVCESSPASFWAAARSIVSQTYEALAPGGVACWVTKAYVKNGAVVDFPGRWRQLCESIGFVTIHEHHPLQVEHKAEQAGLFGESKQIKSSHKSFFKIIHEKKRPDLAIDFEVVFCMVKPK